MLNRPELPPCELELPDDPLPLRLLPDEPLWLLPDEPPEVPLELPLLWPELEPLDEPDDPDEPPEPDCACAPITNPAAQIAIILIICFVIRPFVVCFISMETDTTQRRVFVNLILVKLSLSHSAAQWVYRRIYASGLPAIQCRPPSRSRPRHPSCTTPRIRRPVACPPL